MRGTWAVPIGMLAWAAAAHADVNVGQRLAAQTRPAVVRVVNEYHAEFSFQSRVQRDGFTSTGTGFFINPDGWLATNAHVVEELHAGDTAMKKRMQDDFIHAVLQENDAAFRRMRRDQVLAILDGIQLLSFEHKNYIVLPNGDKLPYEIRSYGTPLGEGGASRDCAIIKVNIKNAPTLHLGDSSAMQDQDRVWVVGYPAAADLKELGDDKSLLEASITDGAVSAKKGMSDGSEVLQVTTPITHGNSGGPGVNEQGDVIGLATFGSDKAAGFNFLVSSATVKEFVKRASAKNQDGPTDQLYRAGLEAFWDARYSDAIDKFRETQEQFPAHSETSRLIQQARDLKKAGKEKAPVRHDGLIAGIILGVMGLGIVIALVVWSRRRKRGRAFAPGYAPRAPPHAATVQPYAHPGSGALPVYQGHPAPAAPYHPAPAAPYHPGPAPYHPGPAPVHPPGSGPLPVPVATAQPSPSGSLHQATVLAMTTSFGSLSCTRGALAGQRFNITPNGLVVGRLPGVAHIVINDTRVTGKHVWIGWENGKIVAIDQGSTNGTFVNDINRGRISRSELNDGDVLIVAEPDVCSFTLKA